MIKTDPSPRATIVSLAICALLVGFALFGTACPPVPPACTGDAECDDGLFCNGVETCVGNACVAGTDPCAEGETCDEDSDECVPAEPPPCESDADCEEGEVCNLGTGDCEAAPAGCTSDADCADVEGDFCIIQTGECVVSADVFGTTRTDFATIHAPAPHAACTVCHHAAGDGVPDATGMPCLDCHADEPAEANSFRAIAHDLDEDGNGCRQCHAAEFDGGNCGFCHPLFDEL